MYNNWSRQLADWKVTFNNNAVGGCGDDGRFNQFPFPLIIGSVDQTSRIKVKCVSWVGIHMAYQGVAIIPICNGIGMINSPTIQGVAGFTIVYTLWTLYALDLVDTWEFAGSRPTWTRATEVTAKSVAGRV